MMDRNDDYIHSKSYYLLKFTIHEITFISLHACAPPPNIFCTFSYKVNGGILQKNEAQLPYLW